MKTSRWFTLLLVITIALFASQPAFSQNFWQRTNGPYGGTVYSLAINSSGHIFAGTNPGVYRSTDNGGNWTYTGLTNTGVWSLAINSSGHIFAGTNPGVYRSTDNGGNWTYTGLTNTNVWSLAINSSGHIFAGTDGGVYRSVQSTTTGTYNLAFTSSNFTPRIGETVHLTGRLINENSLGLPNQIIGLEDPIRMICTWDTTDAFGNFKYDVAIPSNSAGIYSFAAIYGNLKTIVNIIAQNANPENIISNQSLNQILQSGNLNSYVSSVSWSGDPIPYASTSATPIVINTNNSPSLDLYNLSGGSSYLAAYLQGHTYHDKVTYDESYYMQQGGKSFSDWALQQTMKENRCIDPYTTISYGLSGLICVGGLAAGGQAEFCIPLILQGAIDFDEMQIDKCVQRGLCSQDEANRLKMRNVFVATVMSVFDLTQLNQVSNVLLRHGSLFSDIYELFNSGRKATLISKPMDISTMTPECIAANIELQNGNNWTYVVRDRNMHTLRIEPYNTQVKKGAFGQSALEGLNFDIHVYDSSGHHVGRNRFNPDSLDKEIGNVFHSGLSTTIQSVVIVYPNDNYTFRICGDSVSTGSVTFSVKNMIGDSLVNAKLVSANISYTEPSEFSVNCSRGIVTDVKGANEQIPRDYYLFQNYPNPFNSSTMIEFSIPRSGYVTVKIYDVLGREVATLVSERHDAGGYKVEWNASGFASGVYLYRLSASSGPGQADNFIQVRKMLLLR